MIETHVEQPASEGRPSASDKRAAEKQGFLSDVVHGLTQPGQKELSCRYLYDDLGSALFEAITYLPEYGLTRADQRVLARCAERLPAHFEKTPLIAELGSGGGHKTSFVLSAFQKRASAQPEGKPQLTYAPIDISPVALWNCQKELSEYAQVFPILDGYLEGVKTASAMRGEGQPLLVLFLGSTIGNFHRAAAAEFLRALRRLMKRGDALLLGTDLVKPIPQMLLAYDDPTGVTAAFNLNLLGRINRTLGGNFDLRCFRHLARYNPVERRIEMHLEVTEDHEVSIADAGLRIALRRSETIFTESSYKYTLEEVAELVQQGGFKPVEQCVDEPWPFAESLCRAV